MWQHWVESVGNGAGGWLYVLAGGLCFAEAAVLVGMVLPGETALLVAGVFCHRGTLSLPVMIAVAFGCAVAGDSVGFEFGRAFGPGLRRGRVGGWIGEGRWSAVDAFLARHGGKAVLLGRLTALCRALVPSMAGMGAMRYRTFLIWNVVGAAIWAPGCVLLGYGFARSLDLVGKTLTWAPLALVGAAGSAVLVLRRRRGRGTAVPAPSSAASGAGAQREG